MSYVLNIWASVRENLYLGVCKQANNKGADQPAHLRKLISSFIILLLESIISRLAMSELSIFELVSVAGQAGLNLSEDWFCRDEAHMT